ncbi:MAG: hypothetical protein M3M89_04995 [Thermoproteota archaeon]|nr:hypothetical protein [Thermoproteota archaeon]
MPSGKRHSRIIESSLSAATFSAGSISKMLHKFVFNFRPILIADMV